MACFGKKKKVDTTPKYDFSVPTPELPDEPSQFVVIGPVGAGKRTLASSFAHLTLPFCMDRFDAETQVLLRTRTQFTAVSRMIAAFGKRSKKRSRKLDDESEKLVEKLRRYVHKVGIATLTADKEKRASFLKTAKAAAENPAICKYVADHYAKEHDLAKCHFAKLKPEMFEENYEFLYEDLIYSGSLDGPDMIDKQELFLFHKDYPIHMTLIPGERWDTMTLPDSPFEGPYSVIVVIPLDDYIHNEGDLTKDDSDMSLAEEEQELKKLLAESRKSKEEEESKKDEEKGDGEKKKKKKKKGEDEEGDDDDEKKKKKNDDSSSTTTTTTTTTTKGEPLSPGETFVPVKKGYKNKITRSLEIIEKLRNSQCTLFRKAENVVLLLNHFDIFEKLTPEDGSIKNSFPDFSMEENSKNVLNYITDVFEDALHVICSNKVRSTSCCFLDASDVERTVLPHLFDITETTIRLHQNKSFSLKTDAMVARAVEQCGGKPIPVPFNAETMRMTIESGEISEIGKRKTNEDAVVVIDDYKSDHAFQGRVSFYAIFDGHGGSFVSNNCAKCVHKMILEHPAFPYDAHLAFVDSFRKVDKAVTAPEDKSGSTGLCCAIYETTLYMANVGDSECVLGTREAAKGRFRSTLLSQKHNPTDPDEKKRITDMGGSILFGRLFGSLAVSRGFGDMTYKQPGKEYVSVEPHIEVRALDRTCHFLILGCDGLWDTVSYDLAVKTVGEVFDRGDGPDVAAKTLCDLTLSRGSLDNVSVIVVYFRWSHDKKK